MTEFMHYDPSPTGWEIEKLADPSDDADALTELLAQRIAETLHSERCEFCLMIPCDCTPISQREFRGMAARHDQGPARFRR